MEWKRPFRRLCVPSLPFLETFLVEWKLIRGPRRHLRMVDLETFLVEWKQHILVVQPAPDLEP